MAASSGLVGASRALCEVVTHQTSAIDRCSEQTLENARDINALTKIIIKQEERIAALEGKITELSAKGTSAELVPLKGRVSIDSVPFFARLIPTLIWQASTLRTVVWCPYKMTVGSSLTERQHICVNIGKILWEIFYEQNVYTVAAWMPKKYQDNADRMTAWGFNLNHFGSGHVGYFWFGTKVGRYFPRFFNNDTLNLIDFFLSTNSTNPFVARDPESFFEQTKSCSSDEERETLISKELKNLDLLRNSMKDIEPAINPLDKRYNDLKKEAWQLIESVNPVVRQRILLMLGEIYLFCANEYKVRAPQAASQVLDLMNGWHELFAKNTELEG